MTSSKTEIEAKVGRSVGKLFKAVAEIGLATLTLRALSWAFHDWIHQIPLMGWSAALIFAAIIVVVDK